jgi:hypothetical protein
LWFQDFGFEALERQGRAIAAFAEGDPNAGVSEQGENAFLHPAFGQGEMNQR